MSTSVFDVCNIFSAFFVEGDMHGNKEKSLLAELRTVINPHSTTSIVSPVGGALIIPGALDAEVSLDVGSLRRWVS